MDVLGDSKLQHARAAAMGVAVETWNARASCTHHAPNAMRPAANPSAPTCKVRDQSPQSAIADPKPSVSTTKIHVEYPGRSHGSGG